MKIFSEYDNKSQKHPNKSGIHQDKNKAGPEMVLKAENMFSINDIVSFDKDYIEDKIFILKN